MNADIEDYIDRCPKCNSIERSQAKEPMIAHSIPELPWQHVACDLFECDGADYVVLSPAYILTISPRVTVAARYIHTAPAEDNTSNQRSMYCFPQALCEYSGRRP